MTQLTKFDILKQLIDDALERITKIEKRLDGPRDDLDDVVPSAAPARDGVQDSALKRGLTKVVTERKRLSLEDRQLVFMVPKEVYEESKRKGEPEHKINAIMAHRTARRLRLEKIVSVIPADNTLANWLAYAKAGYDGSNPAAEKRSHQKQVIE